MCGSFVNEWETFIKAVIACTRLSYGELTLSNLMKGYIIARMRLFAWHTVFDKSFSQKIRDALIVVGGIAPITEEIQKKFLMKIHPLLGLLLPIFEVYTYLPLYQGRPTRFFIERGLPFLMHLVANKMPFLNGVLLHMVWNCAAIFLCRKALRDTDVRPHNKVVLSLMINSMKSYLDSDPKLREVADECTELMGGLGMMRRRGPILGRPRNPNPPPPVPQGPVHVAPVDNKGEPLYRTMLTNNKKRTLLLRDWQEYEIPRLNFVGYHVDEISYDTLYPSDGGVYVHHGTFIRVNLPVVLVDELVARLSVKTHSKDEYSLTVVHCRELLAEVQIYSTAYVRCMTFAPAVAMYIHSKSPYHKISRMVMDDYYNMTWRAKLARIIRYVMNYSLSHSTQLMQTTAILMALIHLMIIIKYPNLRYAVWITISKTLNSPFRR